MPETCVKFGEHGARVMIEKKEVPHFAMHVNPEKKEVSCWITSEEGKAFTVEWLGVDVDYSSGCALYLDGQYSRKFIRESHDAELIKFLYGRVSKSSLAPFLFSKLVVTDDDKFLDTPASHSSSIGEIKLVISRTNKLKKKIRIKKRSNYPVPPQKLHEHSKKATVHQVNYGSEIPSSRKEWRSWKTLETLVTFIFKYRPLEMLHANGIVPRNLEPPEPQEHTLDTIIDTPTVSETSSGKGEDSKVKKEAESEPEIDDSDEDSMREKAILAEVQRGLAELERIRKARGRHSKESDRPKKRLKKEDKSFFTPGEIIDLTL